MKIIKKLVVLLPLIILNIGQAETKDITNLNGGWVASAGGYKQYARAENIILAYLKYNKRNPEKSGFDYWYNKSSVADADISETIKKAAAELGVVNDATAVKFNNETFCGNGMKFKQSGTYTTCVGGSLTGSTSTAGYTGTSNQEEIVGDSYNSGSYSDITNDAQAATDSIVNEMNKDVTTSSEKRYEEYLAELEAIKGQENPIQAAAENAVIEGTGSITGETATKTNNVEGQSEASQDAVSTSSKTNPDGTPKTTPDGTPLNYKVEDGGYLSPTSNPTVPFTVSEEAEYFTEEEVYEKENEDGTVTVYSKTNDAPMVIIETPTGTQYVEKTAIVTYVTYESYSDTLEKEGIGIDNSNEEKVLNTGFSTEYVELSILLPDENSEMVTKYAIMKADKTWSNTYVIDTTIGIINNEIPNTEYNISLKYNDTNGNTSNLVRHNLDITEDKVKISFGPQPDEKLLKEGTVTLEIKKEDKIIKKFIIELIAFEETEEVTEVALALKCVESNFYDFFNTKDLSGSMSNSPESLLSNQFQRLEKAQDGLSEVCKSSDFTFKSGINIPNLDSLGTDITGFTGDVVGFFTSVLDDLTSPEMISTIMVQVASYPVAALKCLPEVFNDSGIQSAIASEIGACFASDVPPETETCGRIQAGTHMSGGGGATPDFDFFAASSCIMEATQELEISTVFMKCFERERENFSKTIFKKMKDRIKSKSNNTNVAQEQCFLDKKVADLFGDPIEAFSESSSITQKARWLGVDCRNFARGSLSEDEKKFKECTLVKADIFPTKLEEQIKKYENEGKISGLSSKLKEEILKESEVQSLVSITQAPNEKAKSIVTGEGIVFIELIRRWSEVEENITKSWYGVENKIIEERKELIKLVNEEFSQFVEKTSPNGTVTLMNSMIAGISSAVATEIINILSVEKTTEGEGQTLNAKKILYEVCKNESREIFKNQNELTFYKMNNIEYLRKCDHSNIVTKAITRYITASNGDPKEVAEVLKNNSIEIELDNLDAVSKKLVLDIEKKLNGSVPKDGKVVFDAKMYQGVIKKVLEQRQFESIGDYKEIRNVSGLTMIEAFKNRLFSVLYENVRDEKKLDTPFVKEVIKSSPQQEIKVPTETKIVSVKNQGCDAVSFELNVLGYLMLEIEEIVMPMLNSITSLSGGIPDEQVNPVESVFDIIAGTICAFEMWTPQVISEFTSDITACLEDFDMVKMDNGGEAGAEIPKTVVPLIYPDGEARMKFCMNTSAATDFASCVSQPVQKILGPDFKACKEGKKLRMMALSQLKLPNFQKFKVEKFQVERQRCKVNEKKNEVKVGITQSGLGAELTYEYNEASKELAKLSLKERGFMEFRKSVFYATNYSVLNTPILRNAENAFNVNNESLLMPTDYAEVGVSKFIAKDIVKEHLDIAAMINSLQSWLLSIDEFVILYKKDENNQIPDIVFGPNDDKDIMMTFPSNLSGFGPGTYNRLLKNGKEIVISMDNIPTTEYLTVQKIPLETTPKTRYEVTRYICDKISEDIKLYEIGIDKIKSSKFEEWIGIFSNKAVNSFFNDVDKMTQMNFKQTVQVDRRQYNISKLSLQEKERKYRLFKLYLDKMCNKHTSFYKSLLKTSDLISSEKTLKAKANTVANTKASLAFQRDNIPKQAGAKLPTGATEAGKRVEQEKRSSATAEEKLFIGKMRVLKNKE